ncbi:MAG TPA: glycosyltransferase family 1 protein [Vicinamibacterales bacterium]|nr:glycosyltransferase family 1 protein [Vicinamibacterales bacterium]
MTPLRIGVDARELLGATTGVGRYLGELLRRWTERDDWRSRRFLVYAPEPLALPLRPDAAELRTVSGGGRGTWWEQVHLRRAVARDRPDVFFAPAYTAPLVAGVPLAVTIHDVSFAAHPEWFRLREGMRRRWLTRRSARSASVVFTDSEFSRSEIERHLGVSGGRIQVIPPGVAPRQGATIETRDPLVLYVGSIFNRRRLPDLIAAFAVAAAQAPDARLILVGENRTWPPQRLRDVARSHGVDSRVEIRDYVPEAELSELYRRAAVFAFLSEYEGFGLTPLEALSVGVPVVVLDTPVAREIYGPAAFYVQRGDIKGTARLLQELLADRRSAAAAVAAASPVLARYSWERCASDILQHVERVARR